MKKVSIVKEKYAAPESDVLELHLEGVIADSGDGENEESGSSNGGWIF